MKKSIKRKNEMEKAQRAVACECIAVSQAASDPFGYYARMRHRVRRFILHVGPTNSGKTHDALQSLMDAGDGVYLAPLRLLALETGERLRAQGLRCDIITGEERSIEFGATFSSRTVEMFDTERSYRCVVIDEAQMISDPRRGGAWTRAILAADAPQIHICMADEALALVTRLIAMCGDDIEIVRHRRATGLSVEPEPLDGDPMPDDALIAFDRTDVLELAASIEARGIPTAVIYGALPWPARRAEAKRFATGEAEVLIATDAIGMGLNLPIRRVVFTATTKYDGKASRSLTTAEIKQIAGRAGRRGMYQQGFVTSTCRANDWLRHRLEEQVRPLTAARLAFPQELGMETAVPLTLLLKVWAKTPMSYDMLRRIDLTGPITIATMLEGVGAGSGTRFPSDRQTLLGMAFLPVDPQRDLDEVMALYQGLKRKTHPLLPGGGAWAHDYDTGEPRSLIRLERLLRTLGIRFAFARKLNIMDRAMEERFAATRMRLEHDVIVKVTGSKAALLERRLADEDEWNVRDEHGVWRF
ncbi:helicase-related protein [Bifidobacterium leontopitheci]|uniref:Helicase protein n=1 Tax=Bifidobacterium leontopitheci TaxID=2650774 RepID=A0A6I1GNU3_9BIFI|nr:helicase-related protein [Bifidobacterium leontopitheci]KAB7790977.1 helicase protein [Bifidobacterium leontopitheci]